jgi:hypothetical protein
MSNLTIEPSKSFNYAVYRHSIYESGMLEGEPRREFLDGFDTLEEAQEKYPEAELVHGSTYVDYVIPHVAPPDFDPADAGERWDDDY